ATVTAVAWGIDWRRSNHDMEVFLVVVGVAGFPGLLIVSGWILVFGEGLEQPPSGRPRRLLRSITNLSSWLYALELIVVLIHLVKQSGEPSPAMWGIVLIGSMLHIPNVLLGLLGIMVVFAALWSVDEPPST